MLSISDQYSVPENLNCRESKTPGSSWVSDANALGNGEDYPWISISRGWGWRTIGWGYVDH